MERSIEKLFVKMNEDKEFAEKILSQTENEKVIEIAKKEGIELTIEDIDKANEIIKRNLEQNGEGELTEDELENVGGGLLGMIAVSVTAVGISGAAISSAGASATVSMLSVLTVTSDGLENK